MGDMGDDGCRCPTNSAGDIPCHNCGERVNVRCWKCGTLRGEGPCPSRDAPPERVNDLPAYRPAEFDRRRKDGTVEPLVHLADVEVVSVRRERLWSITANDIRREALGLSTGDGA